VALEKLASEAGRHTAALAEVLLTSALTGEGIAALRTHLAALAE
jgi:selenocysteine-specific translation elongation factor